MLHEHAGRPSPEGVHQDGGEITLVMAVNVNNVVPGTGTNRIWSLEQPTGEYSEDDFQRNSPGGFRERNLLHEAGMSAPWECRIVLDRKVKHEGTAFEQRDPSKVAQRDTYLMFIRRPRTNGSDRLEDQAM
jgi:hypothetical protein